MGLGSGSEDAVFQGLHPQNADFGSFHTIRLIFPAEVDQSRVEDSPSPSLPVSGWTRTYYGSAIVSASNKLQLIFPSQVSSLIPTFSALLAPIISIPPLAAQSNFRRKKWTLVASIAAFLASGVIGYLIVSGPLPINDYFVLLFYILLNAVLYLWIYLGIRLTS